MPRLNIRTADQLIEHMAQVKLTRVTKLDDSRHLETALMATLMELPGARLDHVLLNTPTPPHITKGIEKTAQKARFK